MSDVFDQVYEKVERTGFVIRLSQNLPYTGQRPGVCRSCSRSLWATERKQAAPLGDGVFHDSGNEGNDA